MTVGIKDKDLMQKPFTGWRKRLTSVLRFIGRATAFCAGFHKIKKNGRRASRDEVILIENYILKITPCSILSGDLDENLLNISTNSLQYFNRYISIEKV